MSVEHQPYNPEDPEREFTTFEENSEKLISQESLLEQTNQGIESSKRGLVETESQLSEVRSQLGLENPAEPDHSVKASEERIEELEGQAEALSGGAEKMDSQEPSPEFNHKVIEKIKTSKYGEALQNMQNVYRERYENRLNDLAHPEDVVAMGEKLKNLQSAMENPDVTFKEISEQFIEMQDVLRKSLEVPQSGVLSDDLESLKKLGFAVTDLRDVQNELRSYIGSIDESGNKEDTEQLRMALENSSNALEHKMDYINRRYQAIDRY